MANRECFGVSFAANGIGYWRCNMDGKVTPIGNLDIHSDICPCCNRLMFGTHLGSLPIIVRTQTMVIIPNSTKEIMIPNIVEPEG